MLSFFEHCNADENDSEQLCMQYDNRIRLDARVRSDQLTRQMIIELTDLHFIQRNRFEEQRYDLLLLWLNWKYIQNTKAFDYKYTILDEIKRLIIN